MKLEGEVSQEIQIAGPYDDCHLERNNSGACIDNTDRLVRYGLGNTSKKRNDKIKSSDFIGLTRIVITPDMVGQVVGVFTAVEVKKEDWNPDKKLDKHELAQLAYINWIKSLGGLAGFANSIDSFKKIIGK